jgi:hypothetical protein
MQQQLNDMEKKLDSIHDALVGSKLNPKGVIKRVEEVEAYQSRDKKQKWMVAGGFIVISAVVKFFKDIF